MNAQKRPWLDSYPQDISRELQRMPYQNLIEFYNDKNTKYANKTAFSSLGVELTYKQVASTANKISAWLQKNAKPNARIAIISPNCLQYPILIQAIHKSRMVVTSLNPLLTSREMAEIFEDSGAEIIFIWDGAAHTLDNIKTKHNLNKVVVMSITDFFPTIKGFIVDFVLKKVKKLIKDFSLADFNTLTLKEILNQNYTSQTDITKSVKAKDLAFLQYTGGTTGRSKGVMLSHDNLICNVSQASQYLPKYVKEESINVITALPLYHIFALTANYLVMYSLGIKNVLITNPRDIPTFIKTLVKNPPHIMTGVNTLFNALAQNENIKKVDFSNLKLALGGGMPVQKATSDKWLKITNCFILEAYGLSETSPAVTINPHNLDNYSGSIGLPIPGTEVGIISEQEEFLEIGETGELVVKGPQVMQGYWKNEKATKEAFLEGKWFKTGDIAKMDEKGFLYLLDRKKDMVIVSGFNVYPTEVEQIINTIDGVIECGCVGVPDEHSDEVVKAFIIKKTSSKLTKEDVIAKCKEQLTPYKVPKHISFVDDLPRTNVGKVLRRELKSLS